MGACCCSSDTDCHEDVISSDEEENPQTEIPRLAFRSPLKERFCDEPKRTCTGFAHANIDLSTTNEVIEASVEPKVLEPKAKKLIRWQRPPRHPHSLGTRIHCVAMAKAKPKREQWQGEASLMTLWQVPRRSRLLHPVLRPHSSMRSHGRQLHRSRHFLVMDQAWQLGGGITVSRSQNGSKTNCERSSAKWLRWLTRWWRILGGGDRQGYCLIWRRRSVWPTTFARWAYPAPPPKRRWRVHTESLHCKTIQTRIRMCIQTSSSASKRPMKPFWRAWPADAVRPSLCMATCSWFWPMS